MNNTLYDISITDVKENISISLNFHHVKKSSLILRSMNHTLRQQIIKLLDENTRMTVTELYVKLGLEQSVASQHLAILRRAGIICSKRDGKFIYYEINYKRVAEVNRFVEDLVG